MDGTMVCGQCGDPLIRVQFVRPIQIFALIAASSFAAPLIVMLIVFIKDQTPPDSIQSLPTLETNHNVIKLLMPKEVMSTGSQLILV